MKYFEGIISKIEKLEKLIIEFRRKILYSNIKAKLDAMRHFWSKNPLSNSTNMDQFNQEFSNFTDKVVGKKFFNEFEALKIFKKHCFRNRVALSRTIEKELDSFSR